MYSYNIKKFLARKGNALKILKCFLMPIWVVIIEPTFSSYLYRRNFSQSKLTTFEIICLEILQSWMIQPNQRNFRRMLIRLNVIPLTKVPSISRLNRLFNREKIRKILKVIEHYLQTQASLRSTIRLIDSFPIPCVNHVRNRRTYKLPSLAHLGFNGTKKIYFYGMKLHCITDEKGIILGQILSKGNTADPKEEIPLILGQKRATLVIADKGYTGRKRAKFLRKSSGCTLLCPPRKNTKRFKKMSKFDYDFIIHCCKIRRRIESTFANLKRLGSEYCRAHTPKGCLGWINQIITFYLFKRLILSKIKNAKKTIQSRLTKE